MERETIASHIFHAFKLASVLLIVLTGLAKPCACVRLLFYMYDSMALLLLRLQLAFYCFAENRPCSCSKYLKLTIVGCQHVKQG